MKFVILKNRFRDLILVSKIREVAPQRTRPLVLMGNGYQHRVTVIPATAATAVIAETIIRVYRTLVVLIYPLMINQILGIISYPSKVDQP